MLVGDITVVELTRVSFVTDLHVYLPEAVNATKMMESLPDFLRQHVPAGVHGLHFLLVPVPPSAAEYAGLYIISLCVGSIELDKPHMLDSYLNL